MHLDHGMQKLFLKQKRTTLPVLAIRYIVIIGISHASCAPYITDLSQVLHAPRSDKNMSKYSENDLLFSSFFFSINSYTLLVTILDF